MSWTDCVCDDIENHNDIYSECLLCEIGRLGEYSAFQGREISRLVEENRLLRDQVARLQSSTSACEMIRKDQMIDVLEEELNHLTKDLGNGPCAKQVVTATLVDKNGISFEATNHCDNPQPVCPREGMLTGVGYGLCKTVCGQRAHAEVNAIALAGFHAKGATLYLKGHTYACRSCIEAAEKVGVLEIKIEDSCAQANSDVNSKEVV